MLDEKYKKIYTECVQLRKDKSHKDFDLEKA